MTSLYGIDVVTSDKVPPSEAFLLSEYNPETNNFQVYKIKNIGKFWRLRKLWFYLKFFIKYKLLSSLKGRRIDQWL